MFIRICLSLFGIIVGGWIFFTLPSLELTFNNICQSSIGFGLIYAGIVILLPSLSIIKNLKANFKK